MAANTIASAYVQLIPSFAGVQGAIGQAFGGKEGEQAASKAGERSGNALVSGLTKIAGPAAIAGVAAGLFAIGSTFDDVSDSIRTATGKTGADLDGMVEQAKKIGTTVPVEFDKIGPALSKVSQRMGLTGDNLTTVTSQFLAAGNVLGHDVDVDKATASFTAFGVKGKDVSAALDTVFKVSQSTGTGFDDITAAVQQSAPALQGLGFNFQQSAALVGQLDKAGLNSTSTLAAMSKGMVKLAKDGKDPQQAFKEVTKQIGDLVKQGKDAEAIKLASGIFGTKGATQFVQATKNGALNVADLTSAVAASGETILGAQSDTADFAESWTIFKNKAMVAIEPVATAVFNFAGQAMQALLDAFDHLGGVIDGVVTFFEDWKNVLIPVGVAVLVLSTNLITNTIATIANTVATKAAAVATEAWAVAQKVLNLALKNNPIGWIVTAVLALAAAAVWAYENVDTFRVIVDNAWTAIAAAASWAWENVLKPAFGFIADNIHVVGDAFAWLWNAVQVAWGFIQNAISFAWNNIISPIWTAIRIGIAIVAVAFIGLYQLIQFAWDIIQNAISFAWNTVIQPIWQKIQEGLTWLGAAFTWLWVSIIQPVWAAISAAIQWAWTTIIQPVWEAIKIDIALLGQAFNWLWLNVIQPVWAAISAAIQWAWANIISPVWEAIKVDLRLLGDAFNWLWLNVIQPVWNAIGTGIQWGWDHVISPAFEALKTGLSKVGDFFTTVAGGIRDAWNNIKGWVAAPINWVIEHVWNNGIVALWNKVAEWLNLDLKLGTIGLIDSGGSAPAPGPRKGLRPMAEGGQVTGPGGPRSDRIPALLSNGEFVTNAAATAANLPLLLAINNGWTRLADGGLLGDIWSGITGIASGAKNFVGGIVSGVTDAASFMAGFVSDPFKTIMDMLGPDVRKGIEGMSSSPWGKAIAQIPGQMINGVISTIQKLLGAGGGGAGGGGGAPIAFNGTAGVEQWRGLAIQALLMTGQSPGMVGYLLHQMQTESGGNPNAINLWDINAQRGTPSIGLMQVIAPTFASYAFPGFNKNIYDPLSNILASIRYVLGTYGSLPAGYRGVAYDTGGWLMPSAHPVNNLRRPEPVLTPQQWTVAEQAIGLVSGGAGMTVNVYQQPGQSAADLAREMDRLIRFHGAVTA